MRETADRMWTQMREYLGKMSRKNRIQLAILAVVVITLAIVVVSILTRTVYVPLTGTGDATNTSHIYSALIEMGIPAKAEDGRVLVPEDRLGEVQMRLREQGLLGASGFDRGEMDGASGFGISSDHANKIYDFQKGADIALMIEQSPRINKAHVLVSSGESSPFRIQNNTKRASASVVLTIAGGGRLTNDEARTIGEMVRTAIPGIAYEDITITDTEWNHYRIGDASEDLEVEIGQRAMLQNRLTEQIQISVEQLLSPIYGMSNLKVLPNVVLNFDKIVEEQVEFAPPIAGETEGIIRSSEEVYENSRRGDGAEGVPGTDSNNLGTVEYPYGTLGDGYEYARAVFAKNYEINETRKVIEHARGSVESLTIGVLINSEIEDVDGDYTDQIIELVSKGIGTAPGNISVQLIPFAYIDTTMEEARLAFEAQQAAERTQRLIEQIIMYAVILLLGVMLMLLIRTIFKTLKPPPEPEPILATAGPSVDYIVDDEDQEEKEYEDVELSTKSAGLEQIERFIDKDAASVAQLLRNWLADE